MVPFRLLNFPSQSEQVEIEVGNPKSYKHASFYNFIRNCFVEIGEECGAQHFGSGCHRC